MRMPATLEEGVGRDGVAALGASTGKMSQRILTCELELGTGELGDGRVGVGLAELQHQSAIWRDHQARGRDAVHDLGNLGRGEEVGVAQAGGRGGRAEVASLVGGDAGHGGQALQALSRLGDAGRGGSWSRTSHKRRQALARGAEQAGRRAERKGSGHERGAAPGWVQGAGDGRPTAVQSDQLCRPAIRRGIRDANECGRRFGRRCHALDHVLRWVPCRWIPTVLMTLRSFPPGPSRISIATAHARNSVFCVGARKCACECGEIALSIWI